MIIDPNSKDDIIKYLALVCHIIDRDTGEDYVKKLLIKKWDTRLKKGWHVLQTSNGSLAMTKKHEVIAEPFRLKYKNIQTQFYIPKDMCRFYLDEIAERDIEAVDLKNPDVDIIVT